MTSTQVVKTSLMTNNSPSQDYTNPEDQPTTKIDSPGSQPTTVLLKITLTRTINQLQTQTIVTETTTISGLCDLHHKTIIPLVLVTYGMFYKI